MATSTAKPNASSPPWFLISIIGVIIVGFLGIAWAISQGGDDGLESNVPLGGDVSAYDTVTVEGDILPDYQSGTLDAAIGLTAPTLIGTDFSGDEVRIEPDGTPKIVYFLAHWCSHCNNEVPQIVELLTEGAQPEGLDIYAVSTAVLEDQPNYPPNNWLNFKGWNLPVMRDSETQAALQAYGAGGFPYAVYLDGDNTVINRTAGELGKDGIAASWTATVETAAAVADAATE
ncbi:MAG: TlpA family protein disulfide reductase [Acidimicrobiales bacterium]